jgi:hypothetical protein
MRLPFPIAQGFYVDESIPIAAQRCTNFHVHIPQTKTITDGALIGSAGIDFALDEYSFVSLRGHHVMAGVVYFIKDNQLYSLTYTEDTFGVRTYTETPLDVVTIILGSDPVIMKDNGIELLIVAPDYADQHNAWIYNSGSGVMSQISDVDFDGQVNYATYMAGFFVFLKKDSNKFFCSDLRQGLVYDALDFANAESDPDNLVAAEPLNGVLYLFGTTTCEQWYIPGSTGSGFPFVKATSGTIQKGCTAPRSLAPFTMLSDTGETADCLIWIGAGKNEKPAIWATTGGAPKKISTPAIDVLINSGGIENLALAYQCNWSSRGHSFITFTVPDVCCVQYDSTTGLWATRESKFDGNVIPWRVGGLVTAYDVQIVSDNLDGRLGIMDDEIYTEYGENIASYAVFPATDNGGKPFTVNSLELMMETGTCPIGATPEVRISISSDGGRTFSPDISLEMGETGDYERRLMWDMLGRYDRTFVARVDIDEPIKKVIVKGEIDIAS